MEKWDVYDIQGNLTGQTKNKDDDFQNSEYHLASSLWIINNNGKALIQKRASSKNIMPDKWSITGGAVVAGETSARGCIREVHEELGLKLKENDITLLYRSFGKNIIYDDYIITYDFNIKMAALQPDEVSDIKWATINEIKELFYSGDFMFEIVEELEKVEKYIENNKLRAMDIA